MTEHEREALLKFVVEIRDAARSHRNNAAAGSSGEWARGCADAFELCVREVTRIFGDLGISEEAIKEPEIYYFGCVEQTGHFLFDRRFQKPRHDVSPWRERDIDAQMPPYGRLATMQRQVEGRARMHYRNNWTALAFWDRSVDDRYSSNSAFLIEGTHGFDEALRLARQAFPAIFERFKFEIVKDRTETP